MPTTLYLLVTGQKLCRKLCKLSVRLYCSINKLLTSFILVSRIEFIMVEDSWWYRFQRFLHVYVLAVPCLILFTPVFKLYNFITLTGFGGLRNDPTNHTRKVKHVQEQVKEWNRKGRKEGKLMCSARKSWKKMALHSYAKSKYTQISMDLNDVVEIDTANEVMSCRGEIIIPELECGLYSKGDLNPAKWLELEQGSLEVNLPNCND